MPLHAPCLAAKHSMSNAQSDQAEQHWECAPGPGTSPAAVTQAHLCSALGTDHQDPSLGTSMRTWSPPGSELAAPIPGQQTIAGKRKGSHHGPCTVVKNSLADPRDTASIPGSGRSPGVGNGNLLQ